MLRNFNTLMGCTLAASDGEIGKVREMYFDDREWTMRYLIVRAGSWLTGRDVLIAPRTLGAIDAQNSTIAVSLTREQVRQAPAIDTDQPVSRQYEQRYYQYYGWDPYWAIPGGAGMGMIGYGMPGAALAKDAENLEADVPPEPQGDSHLRSSSKVRGYGIHAQDGEFGHVSDFVIDDSDWRVRYFVIATRNWLPGKHVLVAPDWIERISYDNGQVFVNLPSSIIKDAPDYDPAAPLNRANEERLHDHYGRKTYWDAVHDVAR